MTTRHVVIRFDISYVEGGGDRERLDREAVAKALEIFAKELLEGNQNLPIAILGSSDVPAEELREHGVILEANRRFFHPIGLALSVAVMADGSHHVVGLTRAVDTDGNPDPEGWMFDPATTEEQARDRKRRFRKFYVDNSQKVVDRSRALPWGQPEQPISTLYGEWAIPLALEDLTDDDREVERMLRRLFDVGEKCVGRGSVLVSVTDRRKQIRQPPQGVIVRLVAAGRMHAGEVSPDFVGTAVWLSELPDLSDLLGNRES